MSPSTLALLISAVSATGPGTDGGILAANSVPIPLEFIEAALPPPPDKVVLQTSYYGTVTVDHQAHLRRKAHCKDCHGPGPVTQLSFTPKLAHERCRGCHQELQKGPTDCKGCHVLPPKESTTFTAGVSPAPAPAARVDGAAAATATTASTAASIAPSDSAASAASSQAAVSQGSSPAFAASPGVAPGVASGAGATPAGPAAVVAATDSTRQRTVFHRTIQVGLAAGTEFGFSARLTSQQGAVSLSYGIERLTGNGNTRTLLLMGVGAPLPFRLPETLGLFAEGVAGLDAIVHPSVDIMPALGARIGLQWTPTRPVTVPFTVSVTGVVDAFHGGLASPACLYATFGVGAQLQPR